MFDKEEITLNEISEKIKKMPKPDNIDMYIRNGLQAGISKKRKLKIRLYVNIAAIFFAFIFVGTVRMSPVFAATLSRIPGIDYIVKLINYDKGIKAAVDNNFVQHIDEAEEHDGIKVTIKDIIVDKSRAIIFYSIENKSNHKFVGLDKVLFTNEKGEILKAGYSWSSLDMDMSKDKKFDDELEINFPEDEIIPENLIVAITLKEKNSDELSSSSKPENNGDASNISNEKKLSSEWKFQINIDKKKFENMVKTYNLDQTISIENQKIIFRKVTITPTRIAIDIEYDNNNSKKIFRYDDIAIYNEKGEKWGTITNGFSGSRKDDNHETLYFQSNYFTDAKQLFIKGSSIRALDKDKVTVLVDTENKQLLKTPDNNLTLQEINTTGEGLSMEFNIVKDKKLDQKFSYNIFSHYIEDSKGYKYESKTTGSRTRENENEQLIYVIPNDTSIKSVIKLTIEDYPVRIHGNFSVKIK